MIVKGAAVDIRSSFYTAGRQTLKRNLDRLARDLGWPGRHAAYARSWAHAGGWLPRFDAVLCPVCAPATPCPQATNTAC